MNLKLILAAVAVCLLANTSTAEPPPVEVKHLDYKLMSKANDLIGKRLPDAIPQESLSRIILTELKSHRVSGGLNTELTEQETRAFASEIALTLFSKTGAIQKWGQLAEEDKVAELAIITTKGEIFFVDVLQAIGERNVNAFVLRGSGASVRIPLVRDAAKQN